MNIESIVRTRYTSKAYDPMRPLSAEQRQQLLDLLRFSPSSVNSQPWHFFIIESADAKARVKPAFGDLNGGKVHNAALTVIFATRTHIDEAHLNTLLTQEQQDGRFINDEVKASQDKGRRYFVNLNSGSERQQQEWMARQAYISLGFLLLGAATLGLNATPVEGFDPQLLDEILELKQQGYRSVVAATVGYSSEQDFNAGLPKSRLPQDSVITLL